MKAARDDRHDRGDGLLAAGVVKLLLDGPLRMASLYGVVRGRPPKFFDGNVQAFTGLRFHLDAETFECYQPVKMKGDPLWMLVLVLAACGGDGHSANDALADPVGVYHREGTTDAFNVELHEDGTFRGSSCGCDFFGTNEGRWERSGTTVTFLPAASDAAVRLPSDLQARVAIRAMLTAEGFVVREEGASGPMEQRWKFGRLCPICGGRLGPTGNRLCPGPLPEDACSDG